MGVTIPKSLSEIKVGTKYQVLYLDGMWSQTMTVYKLCYSTKTDLRLLMDEDRIKIINDNTD